MFKNILVHIDSISREEIDNFIQKYKVKSPDTGNELSKAEPFNLMFKTEIGPSAK